MKTRLFSLVAAVLLLAGCAHPSAIKLPTTAAVAAPIQAAGSHTIKATASNARAVKLAQAAVKTGIKAGSADAQALAADTQETADELAQVKVQLAAANAALDQLSAQLLTAQKQVDALAADDKTVHARLNVTQKVLKETAGELTAARKELATDHRHAFEDELLIALFDLVAITAAGATLETLFRGVLSAALTMLAGAWHLAWTWILRLLPLAAAV